MRLRTEFCVVALVLTGCIDSHVDGDVVTSATQTMTGWTTIYGEDVRLYTSNTDTPSDHFPDPSDTEWVLSATATTSGSAYSWAGDDWYYYSVSMTIPSSHWHEYSGGRRAHIIGVHDSDDDGVNESGEGVYVFDEELHTDPDSNGEDCRDYGTGDDDIQPCVDDTDHILTIRRSCGAEGQGCCDSSFGNSCNSGLTCASSECCDPDPEVCDGEDNDCDGSVDENAVSETCDGVDNDCDGDVDEDDPNLGDSCSYGGTPSECTVRKSFTVASGRVVCDGGSFSCEPVACQDDPSDPLCYCGPGPTSGGGCGQSGGSCMSSAECAAGGHCVSGYCQPINPSPCQGLSFCWVPSENGTCPSDVMM